MGKVCSVIIIVFGLVWPAFGEPVEFLRSLGNGQLSNPYRITVNGSGCVFAADTGSDQVKKFSPDGRLIYSISSFNGGDRFKQPQGVAVDRDQNIYVIDTGNNRIVKLRDNGPGAEFAGVIASLPAGSNFRFPRAGALDEQGDLYVVDTANDRVIKYPNGETLGGQKGIRALGAGVANPGAFSSPYGATVSGGCIFVADTENHKIKKYSFNKELLMEIGGKGKQEGKLLSPCDVAVDPAGNLYVADTENHRVQKFDRSGKLILAYGRQALADGNFFAPRGLYFDRSSGCLFVTGADNKVQKFDVSLHLAGLSLEAGAIKFSLSEPALLSVDVMSVPGGLLVRSLARDEYRAAGETVVCWDGLDSSGKRSADGVYSVMIAARSVDGKKDAVPVQVSLEVDASPPTLKIAAPIVSVEAKTGALLGISLSYEVSEKAAVRFELYSDDDGVVYRAAGQIDEIAGTHQFFWDGMGANGERARTRKKYGFRLAAADAAGNAGTAADTIIVDGTPPEIKNVSVCRPAFSPGLAAAEEISFEVSDNIFDPLAGLKVSVLNMSNQTVKVLFDSDRVPAGAVRTSWDGRDESGAAVPDGDYKIKLSAKDGAGNEAVCSRQISVDTVPPALYAPQSSLVFSPNGDGRCDSAEYFLRSSERGRVSVKFNGAGVSLEVADITAEAGQEIKLTWGRAGFDVWRRDGPGGGWHLDFSQPAPVPVPDGDYQITASAADQAGNPTDKALGQTTVDTAPPVILALSATPETFTPNEDGVNDTARIQCRFNEPAAAGLNIYRDDGVLFKSWRLSTEASSAAWEWDGRGERNELIGGNYTYSLTARDRAGNTATSESKTIVVDREPALISYAYASPDPFSPAVAGSGFTEIKYYLGRDDLRVRAAIEAGGEIVLKDGIQGKGEHSVRWRGAGAEDGSYRFRISAAAAGGKTAEVYGTVRLDSRPPRILIKDLKGDAERGRLALTYSISEIATVEAGLYDRTGAWLCRIASTEANTPGDHQLSCDLSAEASAYIQIAAVDQAGNRGEARSPLSGAWPGTFQITDPSALPPVFSPDGDGADEQTCLAYKIGGGQPPYRVNVDLSTPTGALVRSLAVNDPQADGRYTFYWDGKADNGSLAAEGDYVCVVRAADQNGEKAEQRLAVRLALAPATAEAGTTVPTAEAGTGAPTGESQPVESDLTVDPASFSTNANPDGSDRPRSTTLIYNAGSAVSVSVRVLDAGGVTVAALTENAAVEPHSWQSLVWDGRTAGGYAPPGRYSFSVEGTDGQGGRSVRRGASVLVQNNVLVLKEPEQLENPEPHYISPGGNSSSPVQKRARLYFLVPVGLTPAGAAARTKTVGKYSVRVFADSGLNKLVRTITQEAPAQAASLTCEDWDGRDDAGRLAGDGTYYMNVSLADFAGSAAGSLTRSVEVDNTPPAISGLSASNRYFSAGSSLNNDPVRSTTNLFYRLSDNGPKATARNEIFKDGVKTGALSSFNWSDEGYYGDGTYIYRVTATDAAGNIASAEGQAVLDRTAPAGTIRINAGNIYTASREVTLALSCSDETSGADGMCFSSDGTDWTSWETLADVKSWTLSGGDGVKTVYVRYADRAGNYTDLSATVMLDTAAPYFSAGPALSGLPANVWTAANSPLFSFTAADETSGVGEVRGYIDGIDQGAQDENSESWRPALSDGAHALKLRLIDKAGNHFDSREYELKVDTTKPGTPSLNMSNSAVGCWTAQNRPLFTWTDPGDGGGSGISYYRAIIDGAEQGSNVSPGWQPSLDEGTHTVCLKAYDAVGWAGDNSNQFIFNIDTRAPYLSQPGPVTFNPYIDGSATVALAAYDLGGAGLSSLSARVRYGAGPVKDLAVINDGGVNYHVSWDGRNNAGDHENEGDYTLEITARDAAGNQSAVVSLISLKDNLRIDHPGAIYAPESGPPSMTYPGLFLAGNVLTVKWLEGGKPYSLTSSNNGATWGNLSAAGDYKNGPDLVYTKQFIHSVYLSNGNLFYRRQRNDNTLVGTAQLTRSNDVVDRWVSLVADNDDNCYVTWQNSWVNMAGATKYSVYFQKVPFNFAPVTGTRLGAQAVMKPASTFLEAPILISPQKGKNDVDSLRPSFVWKHERGQGVEYRVEVAKDDAFVMACRTFVTSANTFAVHEFDPGLEKASYYWRVTALAAGQAATSEVWSFTIDPPLTLTGVSNYPNPFNPDREKTKLRYRLSTDASGVSIRIYDLAGSLVNELTGTGKGEGPSVWDKYNDVEWDGRNGRGEMVLNGIYPFEITARLGGRSVSGRGKIAVLK